LLLPALLMLRRLLTRRRTGWSSSSTEREKEISERTSAGTALFGRERTRTAVRKEGVQRELWIVRHIGQDGLYMEGLGWED
jgi:hypothetical protein